MSDIPRWHTRFKKPGEVTGNFGRYVKLKELVSELLIGAKE